MTDLYIAHGRRLAARTLATETVILKADDSGLYVLNEVGTLLWGRRTASRRSRRLSSG